jgi:hypothetical protein
MSNITMDLSQINEAAASFPWQEKRAYAQFLAQTFYYVRHSTMLLALAAGMIAPGDRKVFDRYIKHIGEERNHDILARRELEGLGFDLDQMPELPSTKLSYWGSHSTTRFSISARWPYWDTPATGGIGGQ